MVEAMLDASYTARRGAAGSFDRRQSSGRRVLCKRLPDLASGLSHPAPPRPAVDLQPARPLRAACQGRRLGEQRLDFARRRPAAAGVCADLAPGALLSNIPISACRAARAGQANPAAREQHGTDRVRPRPRRRPRAPLELAARAAGAGADGGRLRDAGRLPPPAALPPGAGQRALRNSECGALLLFDVNNIRYVSGTKIGEWERDKFCRFALLDRRRRADRLGLRLGGGAPPALLRLARPGELPRRRARHARHDPAELRPDAGAFQGDHGAACARPAARTSRSASTWPRPPCCSRCRTPA